MSDPKYELFEVEGGRWSYRFGDVPSGEVYASREAAGIAAEQTGHKIAAGPTPKDDNAASPDIETLDRERSEL
ncbi:hypothetical protein [Methylopila sp. Yamaguchi]|uniref:hypothetical protein n=1 Tax=Methylopila sp. Yamaguchi TaxID=1437817 RepID=UPI000CB6A9A3|nr:hypothetical protein [Methylopila sp. Yamaguchi]GBD49997.1 hypothetical protein METY_3210 [Methylopila sp. Yamaguchi]